MCLGLVIIVPAFPNYDPFTPSNVTQYYRAILERSKLYVLVWA